MSRQESNKEKQVYELLSEGLSSSELSIKSQDKWKTPLMTRWFDIVIYKGNYPLAVIEVKESLENKNTLAKATDQVRSALSITNARFGIVTDNETFYLYDRNEKENDFVLINYVVLLVRIADPQHIEISINAKKDILSIIKKAANDFLSENKHFHKFINEISFINKINFDYNSNVFFFSEIAIEENSFENQFFNEMFGEFEETKICRYTSFNTLFSMMNYLSFRMNGLVGMNDKSEVNYVDTYLNGIEKPISKLDENAVIALNKRYITSCSKISRKDELTLWRLYADDGKGVCLTFNIIKENLNNKILLQKVKYADSNGNHKELDFLKQIKEEVEKKTGFNFEFRNIGVWKHFFKPFDYAIEEEVRLLIIDDSSLNQIGSDWVLTYTHSILNPFIDFRLNSKKFPIQLSEIILGPKNPEQDSNKIQLEEMIRRKKNKITKDKVDSDLSKLSILSSEIKHYR
jgi:hypothetical protein